jgi:hypothetical protein
LLRGDDQIVLRLPSLVCEVVEIDEKLTVLTREAALR